MLAWAGAARAAARLEVSGTVQSTADGIEVRVDLRNRGDGPANDISLEGELLGARDHGRLEAPLSAGQAHAVWLEFPNQAPRPGVHPVFLALDYSEGSGSSAARMNQRAFLLIAFGSNVPPAVRLTVPEVAVDSYAELRVELSSLDGAAHDVELRLETPRALRCLRERVRVQVPASGRASASFTLVRGQAIRGSTQGILVAAQTLDGEMQSTSVVAGVVEVLETPGLLARWRAPLVALALILLGVSVGVEIVRRRPTPRATP